MTDWQPIETAPRDGTKIILYVEGSVVEGHFDDHYGWGDDTEAEKWRVVSLPFHGCDCCSHPNALPTHWHPLPAPPKDVA